MPEGFGREVEYKVLISHHCPLETKNRLPLRQPATAPYVTPLLLFRCGFALGGGVFLRLPCKFGVLAYLNY